MGRRRDLKRLAKKRKKAERSVLREANRAVRKEQGRHLISLGMRVSRIGLWKAQSGVQTLKQMSARRKIRRTEQADSERRYQEEMAAVHHCPNCHTRYTAWNLTSPFNRFLRCTFCGENGCTRYFATWQICHVWGCRRPSCNGFRHRWQSYRCLDHNLPSIYDS